MSSFANLLNENQDPKTVEKLMGKIGGLLTAGEEVQYIDVQKKPVLNTSPDCVALTNKRVIFCRPKNFGLSMDFKDYLWKDVLDIHLKESMMGADFSLKTTKGNELMDYLPKDQARKLYQFGQAKEEEAQDYRRQRDLEDKRATAGGGIVVNAAPAPVAALVAVAPAADDPMEKLKKLKTMLENELITQAEYDERRNAILATF